MIRRDGRVVEGTGLENRQACKRLQGSNPCPSAILCYKPDTAIFLDNLRAGKIPTWNS